jgi:hypothetical protein
MNNLTRLLFAFCVFFVISSIPIPAQPRNGVKPAPPVTEAKKEVLTNTSIIELTQFGLSDAVIIEKIRQSEYDFDLSVTGLKQLKAARVSQAVMEAMLNPKASSTPKGPPSPVVSPTPQTSGFTDGQGKPVPLPPDKGAYLWDGKKMTLLVQSPVPSQGQNFWRGGLATFVPFVKRKFELQLIGGHAKLSCDHNRPLILVSGLGEVIPGVPSYRLLYVKTGGMLKDRRIVGNYEVGGFFGSVNRVDNEIPCEIKKVAEGIYAITPQQVLADGEYGLVPVPKMSEMKMDAKSFAAPPVWDFGVYVEGKK